jgi:outer membrane protein assembly factor BamE
MPRYRLVSLLLLASLGACSSLENLNLSALGVHRIDVQQGNAIDQENIAKLKPGLSRSQVRFLLGTPLVVDPFRTDRWDYVYTLYKSGKLAEQKRVTLFFKGDTLDRIEGDVPAVATAAPDTATPKDAETSPVAVATPGATEVMPLDAQAAPVAQSESAASAPAATPPAATPVKPVVAKPIPPLTSVVPPLPNPTGAPPYSDPHTPGETSLQAETNVDQVKPDVMPVFPDTDVKSAETKTANAPSDETAKAVLEALKAWASAWANRDDDAYIAAYAVEFKPSDGASRADWEKRRRLLLGLAKDIELQVKSPKLEMAPDGSALVTLEQYYRSDRYRDAVLKQLRLVQHDGKWLIAEERVLSILRPNKK